MIIQQMELHNWISFFGDHVIDFSVGDGSNGNVILIHGETSKGKTSLTSALRWVISGDLRIERKVGGNTAKLPRKLMMFNMPKWKGSLLNWEAYYNRNFKTEISVKFSQGHQNFTLQRSLYASDPKTYSESNQEVEQSLRLENLSSGDIFFDEKAQKIVNEFIPERLLKFFVVEGDFIQEYQETLFSSEKNIDMTDSVKDAIGVEALTRLSQVLRTDFTQVETGLASIIQAANRDKEKLERIDYLKKKIKELKDEVAHKVSEIERLKISLEKIMNVLSSMEDSRQIIEEIRKLEGELEGSQRLLESTSNTISNSMNKVWKMAFTPVVDDLSDKIEYLQTELENLRDQRALCRLKLKSVKEQNEHDEHCPTCKQKWDRGHTEITEVVDIEALNTNLLNLQERIDEIRSKLRNLERLSRYQQSEREVLNLKNDYLNLRELLSEIEAKKNRMEELNSLLDDGSNEEIHDLTAEKIRIEDAIDTLNDEIDYITDGDDNPVSIKKLEKELSDFSKYKINTDDAQQERFSRRLAVLGALRESFKSSEVTFMEKMRKSLDAQMTSQFKELVTDENEKRFFHELKTQDDWSVTCRTIDGRHQPIENPGHMLRGTLAYLGSLRNTSRIEFPVVLDNPAAPLDKPGREALAKLLVENAESQTILLTHSGGYELDNLLSDFASSINKAYLLETSSIGENNRSIARKVKG